MTLYYHVLVYPEGDTLEIDAPLSFNQILDMNGRALQLPLRTEKMVVYRVFKVSTKEERGEVTTFYHLELVTGAELFHLAGKTFPG